jgi:hypothetical protein
MLIQNPGQEPQDAIGNGKLAENVTCKVKKGKIRRRATGRRRSSATSSEASDGDTKSTDFEFSGSSDEEMEDSDPAEEN